MKLVQWDQSSDGLRNLRKSVGSPDVANEGPGPGDGGGTLLTLDQMHYHLPQLVETKHRHQGVARVSEEDKPLGLNVPLHRSALDTQNHLVVVRSFLEAEERK